MAQHCQTHPNFSLIIARVLFRCVSVICQEQVLEVKFFYLCLSVASIFVIYVCKHVLIYVWLFVSRYVCVCVCVCVVTVLCYVLCVFICMVESIYVSPHKYLQKVHKTSVCTFAFRLLPLGLALLFG